MRNLIVILVVMFNASPSFSQYNSDWREVKRKKIKTASTYEISKHGDTTFHRYTYDQKGRLIETREWKTNDFVHEQTYSRSGKLVSDLDLHMGADDRTIQFINGVYSQEYDTSMVYFQRYDEETGAEVYDSVLYYDIYDDGKPNDGWLLKPHGDTTFYYTFERDSFRINTFYIKYTLDSIKYGYAESSYVINHRNFIDPNSPLDTLVHSNVFVLDKKGNEIRCYDLRRDHRDSGFVRLADGTLYSQVNDTLATLILYSTYVNVYRWDGSLKYWVETDTKTGETDRYDNPKRKRSEERISSLNEISKYGPITFEYYE